MAIDWASDLDAIHLGDTEFSDTLRLKHQCTAACPNYCKRMITLYFVAYATIHMMQKMTLACNEPHLCNTWKTLLCHAIIQGAWAGHWFNERPMETLSDSRAFAVVNYCESTIREQFRLHPRFPGWREVNLPPV
jgi:hypothetical protein